MKLQIIDAANKQVGDVTLPAQFTEPVRADLIRRAVLTIRANTRQPYGASPEAGKQHSTWVSRRRRKYRGAYGKGISRVPRKIMSRNGSQIHWVGAFAPGTVGGRRAHPPKAEKIWTQKMNVAERRKAIRSALAATVDKTLVTNRGHKVPTSYPFVLHDDFESLAKTKDFVSALRNIGFEDELTRSQTTRVRAGKGTMRGRKYKRTVGPLVVVASICEANKAARNIPGVEIVTVNNLNTELLAPGTIAGRATLFTKKAIEALSESKLFM